MPHWRCSPLAYSSMWNHWQHSLMPTPRYHQRHTLTIPPLPFFLSHIYFPSILTSCYFHFYSSLLTMREMSSCSWYLPTEPLTPLHRNNLTSSSYFLLLFVLFLSFFLNALFFSDSVSLTDSRIESSVCRECMLVWCHRGALTLVV